MDSDKIQIEIDVTDKASEALHAVGKKTEEVGTRMQKAGETGRLGMFALGEAAEMAAEKMGVPYQVSRRLGNSVEHLASRLGAAGIAFGAVALAASAAYVIYKQFAEEEKKAYEETVKQADAARNLINSIIDESTYTDSLTGKIKALNEQKRMLAERDLEAGISAARQKIIELTDTIKAGGSTWDRVREFALGLSTDQEGYLKNIAGYTATYNKDLEITLLRLNDLTLAQQKNAEGAVKGEKEWAKIGSTAKNDYEIQAVLYQDNQKMMQEHNARQLEIKAAFYQDNKKMMADYTASEKAAVEVLQQRVDALDSFYTYTDEQRRADENRENLYQERKKEMQLNASQETFGNMAQTFQMMSQLHTSHARKYFSIYKTAAIGETIISTSRAAMKAYAEYGPTFGAAAAAAIVALGAAKVAMIRSQSFDGGGGGAVGTYAASPATGLPAGGAGSSPVHLTLIVNGQTQNIGTLTEGVVRELDRNNGTIGGISVMMERSA